MSTISKEIYIIKMRLSSHNLAIEQGRYYNVNRNNRNCKFWIDDMEDEMYSTIVLLKWAYGLNHYLNIRQVYKAIVWHNREINLFSVSVSVSAM
jgi:hypothetical protein